MQKVNSLQGNLRSQKTLLLVSLLVLIADQLTKLGIRVSFLVGESRPEEGFLRLTRVHNEGIVFGLSVHHVVPLLLPIVVIALAIFLSHRYALFNSGLVKASMGLFLGGSLGNLVDRVHLGYVTDFIDFDLWGDFHWPAFNLADAAIVVGGILLIWYGIRLWMLPKHS